MAATAEGDAARIDVGEGARPTPAESGDGGRNFLYLALGALVVAVLGAGTFFALSSGSHSTTARRGEELPVIRAEERPFKVSPEDPGGLEVPNRDKLVYNRMKGAADAPEVERLLPGPEKPLPPPELPVAMPAPLPPPAHSEASPPPLPPVAPPSVAQVEEATPLGAAATAPAAIAVRPIARPAAKPVEVKAETAKPVPAAPVPAVVPATVSAPPASGGGRFQVQLGAMSSPELARAQWAKLVSGNADILGRLQPSIARADLGDKGTLYRLRAGPIDGPERAQQVCKALSGRSIGCVVVSSSG